MDLDFGPDLEAVREELREIFSSEEPPLTLSQLTKYPHGYSEKLWDRVVRAGYSQLLSAPEKNSLSRLAAFYDELGYQRHLLPHLAWCVTATELLALLNSDRAKEAREQAFLGSPGTVPALWNTGTDALEPWSGMSLESGKLTGQRLMVPYFDQASLLIVVTGTRASPCLNLVDTKALVARPLPTLTGESLWSVEFRGTAVIESRRIPATALIDALLPTALAIAALSAGYSRRAIEMAVAWVTTREAFGHTLGQFQVVQHQLVDAHLEAEQMRALTYHAAWALAHEPAIGRRLALSAKVFSSSAFERVAMKALHVFGGRGFREDSGMPMFYRRAKALQIGYGPPVFWEDILASASGLSNDSQKS